MSLNFYRKSESRFWVKSVNNYQRTNYQLPQYVHWILGSVTPEPNTRYPKRLISAKIRAIFLNIPGTRIFFRKNRYVHFQPLSDRTSMLRISMWMEFACFRSRYPMKSETLNKHLWTVGNWSEKHQRYNWKNKWKWEDWSSRRHISMIPMIVWQPLK